MLQNYTTARPLAMSSTLRSVTQNCENVQMFPCFVLFCCCSCCCVFLLFSKDKVNTGVYFCLPHRRTLGSFTYDQIAVERQTFLVLSAISSNSRWLRAFNLSPLLNFAISSNQSVISIFSSSTPGG